MIHPIRSAPALVLTAALGMSAFPRSLPTRFDAPVKIPGNVHVATDDRGHRYAVENTGSTTSLTRWTANGGADVLDFSGGALPTAVSPAGRPSLVAHGNGHLFYLVTEASETTHPLGLGAGTGFGPGHSILYASYDAGVTFDALGYTLKGSGRCGAAADRATPSPYVYAVCESADGRGTLWAYASANDGHTFERYEMGTLTADRIPNWPTVAVGPDGTVWALSADAPGSDGPRTGPSSLVLFRSRDRGRTWTSQDITPARGHYESAWLALSPDGRRLGLGVHFKPSDGGAWRVYGAVWSPGSMPRLVSLDSSQPVEPGELVASFFSSDGRLSVAWTRQNRAAAPREFYLARSN